MQTRSLPLYEEILLLALDDDAGTTSGAGFFTNAMGGAILAELVMTGAVKIADDKKKKVSLGRGGRVDDPILAECLDMATASKKEKKAAEWVMKFAGIKDLKNRVARQLVDKGILTEETGTVLRVFKRTIYPESNPGPEQELRERMKQAIFTGTPNVETRTVIIISLAKAGGMLNKIFPKKKLKERKIRLERLTSGQLAGKATQDAVQGVQAAIMVTAVMPAVFVASS